MVESDDAVGLAVEVRNAGREPVVVVRPIDGSLEGMRRPRDTLYAADLQSGRAFRFTLIGGRYCGWVNPITDSDLREVRHDATMPLILNWGTPLPQVIIHRPGHYALWLEYDTRPTPPTPPTPRADDDDDDDDDDDVTLASLVEPPDEFAALTVTSNAHVIWVK